MAKRVAGTAEGTRTSSGGPITAKNYLDRAVAHMRSSGRADGDHPIIRSVEGESGSKATGGPATPDQWRAWIGYFSTLGYPTVFARKLGVMTVPTGWPWEFDAAASTEIPPEPYPQPARSGRPLTDYERERMAEKAVNATNIDASMWRDRELRPSLANREAPSSPTIDHSKPVTLSPEALAQFGIHPRRYDSELDAAE